MRNKQNSVGAEKGEGCENFSCLVELVGIQDVAEEDVERYIRKTNEFRIRLRDMLDHADFKGCLKHVSWLDRCYLWSASVHILLAAISKLRSELISNDFPAFLRASVMRGTPKDSKGKFNEVAAMLADRLLRFKAVGVDIDQNVRDYVNTTPPEQGCVKQNIFQNCHLIGEGAKQNLRPFWDLAWQPPPSATSYLKFDRIFDEAIETISRSPKSSKYFSPFFVNIARHLEPNDHTPASDAWPDKGIGKPRHKIGERLEPHEDDNLSNFLFTIWNITNYSVIKAMPGGDLILLTLVDRMHSEDRARRGMKRVKDMDDEICALCDRFAGSYHYYLYPWIYEARLLLDRIQRDHPLGLPPDYVLSGASRGEFRKRATRLKTNETSPG